MQVKVIKNKAYCFFLFRFCYAFCFDISFVNTQEINEMKQTVVLPRRKRSQIVLLIIEKSYSYDKIRKQICENVATDGI